MIVANDTDKESYINFFKSTHINIDAEYDATSFINPSGKITIITKDQEDDIILKIKEKGHPFHSFHTCLEEINNQLNSYQWEHETKEFVGKSITELLTLTKELSSNDELNYAFKKIIELNNHFDENTLRHLYTELRKAGPCLDSNHPSITKKISTELFPDFSVNYDLFQNNLIETDKKRPGNSSSSSEKDSVEEPQSIGNDSQKDDIVDHGPNNPKTDTEAPFPPTENNFVDIMKELGDEFKQSLSYDKYTNYYNEKYKNKSKKPHFIENTQAFEAQKEYFFTTNDSKISPPLLGFVFNQLIQMPAFNEKDPDLEKTLEFLKIYPSGECIRLINSKLSHVQHNEAINRFKEKLKNIDIEKDTKETPPH